MPIHHVSFKGSCPDTHATPDPLITREPSHTAMKQLEKELAANLIVVECPWGLGRGYLGKLLPKLQGWADWWQRKHHHTYYSDAGIVGNNWFKVQSHCWRIFKKEGLFTRINQYLKWVSRGVFVSIGPEEWRKQKLSRAYTAIIILCGNTRSKVKFIKTLMPLLLRTHASMSEVQRSTEMLKW